MGSLRQTFETWLQEHFEVAQTQEGKVSKTRGLPQYEGDIAPLLGSRFGWDIVNQWRAGQPVPGRLLVRLERIIELEDTEVIRDAVRDEAFVDEVAHAMHHHQEFGTAPDGGDLFAWVERCRARIGAPLSTPEARQIWGRVL